jgi:outer membrane protein assembly factor BamB
VQPAADLDDDGIADTLIDGPRAPNPSAADAIGSRALGSLFTPGFARPSASPCDAIGSRTAVARSGRDGRVIWKTELDPRRIWYEGDHGEYYYLTTRSLPAGDLDRDGTPEVFVQRHPLQPGALLIKQAATLPLQVLSGRTGRHLWSAGPLPLRFEAYGYSSIHWALTRVVEPHGRPDVVVRHGSPFVPPRPLTTPIGGGMKPRLARVSGRDGRILWDLPLSEHLEATNMTYDPHSGFGDLDGDGALDVVVALPGSPDYELTAVSLRDGKLLWSHRLDFKSIFMKSVQLAVADRDGDQRPEVLVAVQPGPGAREAFELKALDGRDGTVRWTWNSGAPENPRTSVYGWLCRADFAGNGRSTVCLNLVDPKGLRRILVFDDQGREIARRELPQNAEHYMRATDVNGDGRDELLLWYDDRLHTWTRDLKDLWSSPLPKARLDEILLAAPGQPGTVVVNPAVGLDGADGHPRWAGQPRLAYWGHPFTPKLLDNGHSVREPLMVSRDLGATICRMAIPTNAKGAYESTPGAPVRPGLARDDPRWTRPLPWTIAVDRETARSGLLALVGLALFNVLLPLGILRLAAPRRPWTMRVLMALPIAAAIPLTAIVAVEPLIPTLPAPYPSSSRMLFTLGTLAGIPIVSFAAVAGWSLVRRRWRSLALLAGLTILASLVIGTVWLWTDFRSMPTIEQYTWSGWYLAVLPGAYAVGVLMVMAWATRGALRWARRPRRAASGAAQAEEAGGGGLIPASGPAQLRAGRGGEPL